MKRIAITCVLVMLVGCNQQPQDRIDRANALLRAQVASDVTVDIDRSNEKLVERSGADYYVCGTGIVNQPGLVDHRTERFIVSVNASTDRGITIFDGSRDPATKADFQRTWDSKCESAAK